MCYRNTLTLNELSNSVSVFVSSMCRCPNLNLIKLQLWSATSLVISIHLNIHKHRSYSSLNTHDCPVSLCGRSYRKDLCDLCCGLLNQDEMCCSCSVPLRAVSSRSVSVLTQKKSRACWQIVLASGPYMHWTLCWHKVCLSVSGIHFRLVVQHKGSPAGSYWNWEALIMFKSNMFWCKIKHRLTEGCGEPTQYMLGMIYKNRCMCLWRFSFIQDTVRKRLKQRQYLHPNAFALTLS